MRKQKKKVLICFSLCVFSHCDQRTTARCRLCTQQLRCAWDHEYCTTTPLLAKRKKKGVRVGGRRQPKREHSRRTFSPPLPPSRSFRFKKKVEGKTNQKDITGKIWTRGTSSTRGMLTMRPSKKKKKKCTKNVKRLWTAIQRFPSCLAVVVLLLVHCGTNNVGAQMAVTLWRLH